MLTFDGFLGICIKVVTLGSMLWPLVMRMIKRIKAWLKVKKCSASGASQTDRAEDRAEP